MAASVLLVMLVLMTASTFHLPVNDGIRDPSDVGPDNSIPSLACE
jgi:hypothetical protein